MAEYVQEHVQRVDQKTAVENIATATLPVLVACDYANRLHLT